MDRRRKLGIKRTLALLAVLCLVECTSGSCLSYGHSCWGAHGKRSNAPAALPPDLYLLRLLGRLAFNKEMEENNLKRNSQIRNDLAAIYRTNSANDDDSEKINDITNNKHPQTAAAALYNEQRENRHPDGIPMLDDDLLSKTRIWKLMKAAASNEQ